LYQVSTIDALLSGVYDSAATVGDVTEHGGFGLGTFDALDGELIALDGVVYQAAFDGSVTVMSSSTGTPFMAVTHFEADRVLNAPAPFDYAAFKQWLETSLPSRNIVYAVQADARASLTAAWRASRSPIHRWWT
jgi:acetolactate decarboxylase